MNNNFLKDKEFKFVMFLREKLQKLFCRFLKHS